MANDLNTKQTKALRALASFLRKVRGPAYRGSVNVVIDNEGLEVSLR